MRRPRLPWLSLLAVLAAGAQAAEPADLAMNEIQVLGSHNSYKLAMEADRFAELEREAPEIAASLEYTHRPLAEQLDLGIRTLELDVYYDPEGMLFPGITHASGSRFPVLHVQNLDDNSSCPDLLSCLSVIAQWSKAHPEHVPVFISFNAKDEVIDRPGFLRPLPFDEDAWLAMDAEIRAAFGERLIEPADVVGPDGPVWPALADARGHVLTILDEGGSKRAGYA
ncbi:MAG: Ca2+-dependent phosphoinositide-specific phospholipase C, partial [Pseudomonadales bacterium]